MTLNNFFIKVLLPLLFLLSSSVSAKKYKIPLNVKEGYLRIATWNIKYLGDRKPLRTDDDLMKIAEMIKRLDFAVVALQEIQSNKRILELVDFLGDNWRVNHQAGWVVDPPSENETCLLWNTSKVKCMDYGPWLGCVGYKSRPPFSGIFQPVEEGSLPFVVISNHAYPGNNSRAVKIKKEQGVFYRKMVLDMLRDESYPNSIFLVGDFNGKPGRPPHTTIQDKDDESILYLLGKADKKGTVASLFNSNIDHIYATKEAISRVNQEIAFVMRPHFLKENCHSFNRTYSDHLPVFVDCEICPKI